ncbi:unnamed protein product, partial [Rangifer tarandus platyrhynchus]
RPGGSLRWHKPVEERVAGAEGRAQRQLRAPRRLPPSPGRAGTAGRAGGGSEDGREWGRRAAASGSAAARRSRDHAWPHPPYRYAQSPALSTPPPLATSRARGRAPENISLRLPTPQPPPRKGPPLEGRGGGGRNEQSAPMRPGMRLGGRGAHRGCAAASLLSPPTPAPHRPRTQKHWGPGSPRRPRPGSAASLPPRRSPGAGQRRGSGVLPAWARAPPPAAPKPAREATP